MQSFGTQSIPDDIEGQIRTEPFSLTFEVVADVDVPTGTYNLEHESMDELLIMLTPISRTRLEAIYN